MAKYRKKPVVIDAVLWTGDERDELIALSGEQHPFGFHGTCLRIKTLKGVMEAYPGDWVIRGVKGEFYPCKPEIFAATYDAVETVEPPERMDFLV